jgi:hypothetical protein
MKTVAIVQSNYIPWKGYFDLIRNVDEFILFDDVQYTRRDWRNRNKIKTAQGMQWLTIPVEVKGKFLQKINETVVSDPNWNTTHLNAIRQNYARAPHFANYKTWLEGLYLGCTEKYLSHINHRFMVEICKELGITTPITWSSDYDIVEGKNQRLIHLCQQAGASVYISGPAARDYMDLTQWHEAGIEVLFANYDDYIEYHQLYPPFNHFVTVLDLILNEGKAAPQFLLPRSSLTRVKVNGE